MHFVQLRKANESLDSSRRAALHDMGRKVLGGPDGEAVKSAGKDNKVSWQRISPGLISARMGEQLDRNRKQAFITARNASL